MKIRWIFFILTILLAIGLAGCGSRDSGTSESSAGTTTFETSQTQAGVTEQGFTIRVLATDGPIRNAAVTVLIPEELRSFSGTTDANGEIIFAYHSGHNWLLSVSAPCYVPSADLITPEPGRTLEINMQKAGEQHAWWMAFATHDPYSTVYQGTSRAKVWLAFSDDGLFWQLADSKPIYECDVKPRSASMARQYPESVFHALVAPGGPSLVMRDGG